MEKEYLKPKDLRLKGIDGDTSKMPPDRVMDKNDFIKWYYETGRKIELNKTRRPRNYDFI